MRGYYEVLAFPILGFRNCRDFNLKNIYLYTFFFLNTIFYSNIPQEIQAFNFLKCFLSHYSIIHA